MAKTSSTKAKPKAKAKAKPKAKAGKGGFAALHDNPTTRKFAQRELGDDYEVGWYGYQTKQYKKYFKGPNNVRVNHTPRARELIRKAKAVAEKMKDTPPAEMLTELQRQLAAVASELGQAETNYAEVFGGKQKGKGPSKEAQRAITHIQALKAKCMNTTIAVADTLKMTVEDQQSVDILEKVKAGVRSFYSTNQDKMKGERRLFESDETFNIRSGIIANRTHTYTEAVYLTSLRRDLGKYIVKVMPTLPSSVQSATKEIFVPFTGVNDQHVKQASRDRKAFKNESARKSRMKRQEQYEAAQSTFKTAEANPECSKEELIAKKDDMRTKYYKTSTGACEKYHNGGIEYPTRDECIKEAEEALSLMTIYKFCST